MNSKFIKILVVTILLVVLSVANIYAQEEYSLNMSQSFETVQKVVASQQLVIPVGTEGSTSVVTPIDEQDMRIKALENVFEKYNSPLTPHAGTYVEVADKYGIDWKLLPAIAGLESSFGKHQMPGSHNSYGWGGGHIYFESYEDGIETIIKSLKNHYYDRGADTIYKIAPIYAESPTWAPRVTNFVNQIESELERIKATTLTLTI